ncbi:hypothetical protein ACFL6Z_04275 [Pseudomonadota bacterium]
MSKKNIVLIVGTFIPFPSAVGNCALNMARVLGQDHNVTVICLPPTSTTKINTDISYITRVIDYAVNTYEKSKSKSIFGAFYYRGCSFLFRLLSFFRLIFKRNSVDGKLVKSYCDTLNHIDSESTIDIVMPFIFPIEAAVAASNFKSINTKVKVVNFYFDDFLNSATLHRFRLNKYLKSKENLNVFKSVYFTADLNLAMESFRKNFESLSREGKVKTVFVEHPLLVNRGDRNYESNSDNKMGDSTILFYGGALIKGYVEAGYLLKLLQDIETDFIINFCIFGSGISSVNNADFNDGKRLINCGKVSKVTLDDKIETSNFLISIGEVNGKQISSKVFEYMSFGKPLIHIASNPNCATARLLEKYPLALIIYENSEHCANLISMDAFLKNNKNKRLSFCEVAKIYPEALPSNVAKTIFSILEE